jgi:hypothetical protein
MRRFAPLALALAGLILIVGLGASAASARTYAHGKTVWFSDKTLSDGDEVRGDLDVVFGNVRCEEGAVIDGNVRTFFGNFVQLDGCTVAGRVIDAFDGDQIAPFVPALSVPDALTENRRLVEKLAWDVVVVFVFLLFPMRVRVALDRVERHPGMSGAAGTLAAIAVLPVAVMLLLSIVGIPLIVIEFAAILAGIWIGHAAIALLVGRRLYELVRPHATPSPLGALLLGLVVVSAAQTLPVVGWAVTALVWTVGLGASVLAFMRESSFHSAAAGPGPGLPANPAA